MEDKSNKLEDKLLVVESSIGIVKFTYYLQVITTVIAWGVLPFFMGGEGYVSNMLILSPVVLFANLMASMVRSSMGESVGAVSEYNHINGENLIFYSGGNNSLNNVVKLKGGKVYRIYQLIDENRVLSTYGLNDLNILDDYDFVPIKGEIVRDIGNGIKREDLSIEGRAVYDIGVGIPKLSIKEIKSLLTSIKSARELKIQEELDSRYNKEYGKLDYQVGNVIYKDLPNKVSEESIKLGNQLKYLKEDNENILKGISVKRK